MRAGHTTPDHANFGTVYFALGTVYIGDALAKVELSVLRGLHTFNLDKRDVGILVALSALETEDTAFGVEALKGSP
ncbi:hypothetical protein BC936DRAFT_138919 [Jimgerdemannia flammicorona]|uniref:Uncharacterized protein n=2 Tax=Jimgerdemannia flammicorona TaxID=994334 RepID=A0A433BDV8_9FUNG|nr:hypothetical protein BC936DRAFT_138919 [Jimgerdemannia flammicorona]RUS32209.1 hypothetical protein BC938DRAFT_476034 [Jimgerdemannia flammicorona]